MRPHGQCLLPVPAPQPLIMAVWPKAVEAKQEAQVEDDIYPPAW